MTCIVVTGGCGFIGTNFIQRTLELHPHWKIVNIDALTYAGHAGNMGFLESRNPGRYRFVHGNIDDSRLVKALLEREKPAGVIHFAAESHVDRSIKGPMAFVETNVAGTCRLLAACHDAWKKQGRDGGFRFIHVSTDEVYGSLGETGAFTETTSYDPSSPYSASKAASDHFARAWHRTYGFPTIVTNCSNNYGPYQFPEKLIPLMIQHILENKKLPVYGDGKNVRDWLYVIDHCDALLTVFQHGKIGETYNIGGGAERSNIEIVHALCDLVDDRLSRSGKDGSRRLIEFVTDRPGHDRRYAIDASKIRNELGWEAGYQPDDALALTVDWYLNNQPWIESIKSGEYMNWMKANYEKRDE